MEISITAEELRKRKLFVGVPMYGGMCAGIFARSIADLTALCAHYKIDMRSYFIFNESLITRARNYITDEFMRSGYDHLMFIDSDIGFQPQDVIAMLALQSKESPYDVIAGPYPKKTISWEKIKLAVDKGIADENPNVLENFVGDYVFNPKSGATSLRVDQPIEVMEVGTGFMMIRREALEDFANKYGHYSYRPDHIRTEHFDGSREIMQFFQAEIDIPNPEKELRPLLEAIASGEVVSAEDVSNFLKAYDEKVFNSSKRYLSEDYWFCQRLIDIGRKIWYCPWMRLQHMGTYIFGGSLIDLASIGAPATADPSMLKKLDKLVESRRRR